MSAKKDIQLVYDRECPICDYYACKVEIDESKGTLEKINAREQSDVMAEITARGHDIDQGNAVIIDGEHFYGADAVRELALISSPKGPIASLWQRAFRSPRLSKIMYPALRACRNLLLKMLGRSRINNLQRPGRDRF